MMFLPTVPYVVPQPPRPPLMVGRWPKRHGEDTHDLFTDPDPTDHDDGEAPASR